MSGAKLEGLRFSLERKKGQRDRVAGDISDYKDRVEQSKEEVEQTREAQLIIQSVAQKTQRELEYAISELVSLCMDGVVLDEAYNVVIDFVLRRNKTEADIYYERDDLKVKPLDASGGGAVNVGAFGLRTTLWHLQRPRSRNSLWLDEPFPQLKGVGPNERVLQMVQELCLKLGLQIVMVSDERVSRQTILENADRVFEVSIKNGRSQLEVVK
jgi:DNA repair exonuclease SbcCD ATPase subunit